MPPATESSQTQALVYLVETNPYSADTMDHDAFVHTQVFRSVIGTLVTPYQLGSTTGVIASSWEVSGDQLQWTFQIRNGLTFASGTPLSSQTVLRSFLRLGYLLQKRKSHSDFFNSVVGYGIQTTASSPIEGLKADQVKNTFSIVLTKPVPHLLDVIGFGLFGVVNPNAFDAESGDWLDKRSFDSSSFYLLSHWSDQEVVLKRRDDFLPNLRPKHSVSEWKIVWDRDAANVAQTANLVIGFSTDAAPGKATKYYSGPNNQITYVQCLSAKDPKSVMGNARARVALRDFFYEVAESNLKTRITKSFFPLEISGITELASTPPSNDELKKTFSGVNVRYRAAKKPGFMPFADVFMSTIQAVAQRMPYASYKPLEISLEEAFANRSKSSKHSVDLAAFGTGILIEEPLHDIRFMFLSKEGIQLPDLRGLVSEELKKTNPNVQRIQEILWEDGAIWPLGHYSQGLWASEELDLSRLNTVKPPTELIWIEKRQ